MGTVSMHRMRHIQQRISRHCNALIDWGSFSVDGIVQAVAKRVNARIYLIPSHWDEYGYSGLTLGCTDRFGRIFLVIYEQDVTDEHRLVIVLHELLHILLGHCSADVSPDELRRILRKLGLIDPAKVNSATQVTVYTRMCSPSGFPETVKSIDEMEADIGALWIVTKARQAGCLPPTGHLFMPEHASISTLLAQSAPM